MSSKKKIINSDSLQKKDETIFKKKISPFLALQEVAPAGLLRQIDYYVVGLIGATALFLALLMVPLVSNKFEVYQEGSIAPHTVKIYEELLVEDVASTSQNREEAKDRVIDVYDLDLNIEQNKLANAMNAFDIMTQGYATYSGDEYRRSIGYFNRNLKFKKQTDADIKKVKEFEATDGFKTLETEFVKMFKVEFEASELELLRKYHYAPLILDRVAKVASQVLSHGIISGKEQLSTSTLNGIKVRVLPSLEERLLKNFESILDLDEADEQIEVLAKKEFGKHSELLKIVILLVDKLIEPNLSFNASETNQRKEEASTEEKPVYFKFRQGEVIVRAGDTVTESVEAKLFSLASSSQTSNTYSKVAGLFLVSLMLLTLATLIIRKFYVEIKESYKLQLLMAILLCWHLTLAWAVTNYGSKIYYLVSNFGVEEISLATPFIAGPLIVSIFFNVDITILFTIFIAAFVSLLYKDFNLITIMTFVGGILSAYNAGSFQRRLELIKRGLIIAVVNGFLAFMFIIAVYGKSFSEGWDGVILVFLGIGLSIAFVSVFIPIFEAFFPVVSDIKLIELANPDHPALRRLLMEAPGTYHHSMMVSYLSEEAAKSIEANALLARAGAMFHDIGKSKKSEYFVENQLGRFNPHDKLAPSMSALILINHIKEGVELAKQYKLLPQIKVMIPEHHGTQLIKFFYNKAVVENGGKEVDKEPFRYPGPIPSSKESACVAIADGVEAAARACVDPTPVRLRKVINDVINDKFIQGQLDNSNLTLSDLAKLADGLERVLTSIHHNRIQYPTLKA